MKNKRLKPIQSTLLKYEKYMKRQGCKVSQCFNDTNFNIWSHTSAYKYVTKEIGLNLRELYDNAEVKTQKEFESKLKSVMGKC